jgi:hypothetical protein
MNIFERLGGLVETAAPYVAPLIPGLGVAAPVVGALSAAEISRRQQKAISSQFATGSMAQGAVASTGSLGAQESPYSGEIYAAGMAYRPMVPAPVPTTAPQIGAREMAGTVLDIVYDGAMSFFGGDQQVCGTARKPLVSVRMNRDGSQCLSVTRKQQHQLKQMVMYLGINGTADYVGLSVQELAGLLVKKFPPRRKGISAAQLRNAKRVNRQVMGMAKQLQDACKTTTRRR